MADFATSEVFLAGSKTAGGLVGSTPNLGDLEPLCARKSNTRPRTRQIRTCDQTWARSARKRWPCDDGGKSLVCNKGMCLDASVLDALLRVQSNDGHCTQLTMLLLSIRARGRRRAVQVHG